jgi:hypothetical protein
LNLCEYDSEEREHGVGTGVNALFVVFYEEIKRELRLNRNCLFLIIDRILRNKVFFFCSCQMASQVKMRIIRNQRHKVSSDLFRGQIGQTNVSSEDHARSLGLSVREVEAAHHRGEAD